MNLQVLTLFEGRAVVELLQAVADFVRRVPVSWL